MTISVVPTELEPNLAHDLIALLDSDPYADMIRSLTSGEGMRHLQAAEFVASFDGHLAGFCRSHESAKDSGHWFLHIVVPPLHPHAISITEALLDAARRQHGEATLTWWTEGSHLEVASGIAERYGFERTRTVLQMERSVAALTIAVDQNWRTFRPGDEARVVEINNSAFADHPDRSGWTERSVLADLTDPADLILMPAKGEAENEAAGFCWLHSHQPGGGEIKVLAVHADHHGQGLGKKLLRVGVAQLTQRGHTSVELYVDHYNEHAVSLYEGEGFTAGPRTLIAYAVPPVS